MRAAAERRREELARAATRLREESYLLGGWGCLAIPIAAWLDATAERVGGHSWTGSKEAIVVARLINEVAA